MTAYLFDTNIWLRAVQRESPHHALAVNALAMLLGRGDAICLTAQNLIEFWSVASRPIEIQWSWLASSHSAPGDRSAS